MMGEFERQAARRARRTERRGISGLGLLLLILGLLALLWTFSALPAQVYRFWPLVLVAVGLFGLVRRPGWVQELDWRAGPAVSNAVDRPRRVFSGFLVLVGGACLAFTLGLVPSRFIGPGLLIAVGLLLLWRRAR